MQPDERKHALLCALCALAVVGLVWIERVTGLPVAAFVGGALIAFGYEGVQWYRREGAASLRDALFGCAGAAVAAIFLAAAGVT